VLLGGRIGIGDAVAVLWLVGLVIAGTGRLVLFGAERATLARTTPARRTLIIGAGLVGRLTARRLLARPRLGLLPVGFLDKEPLTGAAAPDDVPLPVLGASWDLERVVEAEGIDTVVVAFSTAPHHVLLDLVRRSWQLGADVMLVPRLYEVEVRRLHTQHIGGLPLVALGASDPNSFAVAVKYAIDRVAAGVALLLLAPVLAVTALAVRCSLGRPILFRQQRVGLDGHAFEMLKFRTMHGAPDEHGEADAAWADLVLAGDGARPASAARAAAGERRSRVGDILRKLSLDELPQLWNVVRGDMSLIGPRPERTHYARRFEDVVYRYGERHRVKSGLTGWAQVHGLRGETSLADRIEWDNFYIENWSFWLDLKIVVMTLPALIGRRGGR
jgi:exopolysaccharide biosynthesis polyprenyl glycosylphosphotransferase